METVRNLLRVRLVLFLSVASTALAERPSFGVKVGVPVSAVCQAENLGSIGSANSCADRYVIGPAVQIYILPRLSLDISALFTTVQLQGGARLPNTAAFSTQRNGTLWEFPIVPKYRFLKGDVSPFVGAGPTFRRITMDGQNTIIPLTTVPGQPLTSVTPITQTQWEAGLCLAAGIEFRTRAVRLTPEIRYLRWSSSEHTCDACGPYTLPLARSNATVLLLDVSF